MTSYRGRLFNRLMMMCNCIRSPIRHVQYILALNKEKKRFYSWMKLGMKIYGYYSYLEPSPSELQERKHENLQLDEIRDENLWIYSSFISYRIFRVVYLISNAANTICQIGS